VAPESYALECLIHWKIYPILKRHKSPVTKLQITPQKFDQIQNPSDGDQEKKFGEKTFIK